MEGLLLDPAKEQVINIDPLEMWVMIGGSWIETSIAKTSLKFYGR